MFNNPEDSDVLLQFVPDETFMTSAVGIQPIAELQPTGSNNAAVFDLTATGLAVQTRSSRKRERSIADVVESSSSPLSLTLHLHNLILLRSEYFKALIKRWRPAAQSGGEPSASLSILELVEKVPKGQLDAAELAVKCMYNGAAAAKAAGNAMLLLHAYQLAERFDIPAACMDKIAAALSALRAESLTLDVLQARMLIMKFKPILVLILTGSGNITVQY